MLVKTKVMSFDKSVFNDETISVNINGFLSDNGITHDMLIDIKMTQIKNTAEDLKILIIYKEY